MKKNPIDVPSTVKDVQAYLQYRDIIDSEKWINKQTIPTSNGDIDPRMIMYKIEEILETLEDEEAKLVEKKVRAFKVQLKYVADLKRKAFGAKKGGSRVENENIRILDERSSELIEYFGQLKTVKEVLKIVHLQWGYDIGHQALSNFKKKHEDEVAKKTIEYFKDVSKIRLSHQKGRLEELQYMFFKRKAVWEQTHGLADETAMLKIFTLIQKEMVEKKIELNANIQHTITANINIHVHQEIMKAMPINDIILARAAQKLKINPTFLIARLHKSMYAKHTGFVEPEDGLDQEEIIYPSSVVYPWKQIRANHKKNGDEGIELTQYQEVKEPDVAKTLKELLQEKIEKKRLDIASAEDRIIDNEK